MKRHCLFFFIAILTCSYTWAQTPIEDELLSRVLGMEGKTHLERSEFIKDQLRTLGFGYVAAPFTDRVIKKKDTTTTKGENIIVRLGKGTKKIVVGAHFDAFSDSPGANDNASGTAVLLSLIQQLQDIEWNYTVEFCFFDQEEAGIMGSRYYVKQFVIPQRHFAMINLDIEGTGEEVYVGPVGNNNRTMIRYIHEAAQKKGFPLYESAEYPPSDHESFAKFNLQNISISIVPRGDGERLSKYVHNGYKADSLDTPQILGVMHTFEDRSRLVTPSALKMSFEFTKTLLLLLNESGK
jgi:Zn-dependent M28 family amino/carboxypeptidase